MIPHPPPGQGPIDPQGAFVPPPTPADGPAPSFYGSPPMPPSGWVPQGYTPPGYTPPGYSPPPRRRWGVFRVLSILFLVLFFGGSLVLNVVVLTGLALSGSGEDNFSVVTTTVKPGDPKQKVAVVTLAGAIDGGTAQRFDRLLDTVEKDEDVKTLVLEVDSPGGTVTGSDEIYARLLRYKAARTDAGKNATVVVTMRSVAASGGYYVSCAADHVFAEQTTLTGNIGVLMSGFNVSGLMDKYGVQESTIVSTGADFKNVGSPFSPETPEGRKYLQGVIDEAADRFHAVVKAGRGAKVDGSKVFNAKIFSGPEALKLGLVDALGYPDDAYTYAANSAGLGNPSVVRFREPAGFSMLHLLAGVSGSVEPAKSDAGMPVPNVRDLVRPETLDAWRTTRLLYR